MALTGFDHYTVRTGDLDAAIAFYSEVLGMSAQIHTDLGFRLAVMSLGDSAPVHLLETGPGLDAFFARNAAAYTDADRRITGNLEHVAFNGDDCEGLCRLLTARDIPWRERTLEAYAVRQLFFNDPDGIEVEVNFPLE